MWGGLQRREEAPYTTKDTKDTKDTKEGDQWSPSPARGDGPRELAGVWLAKSLSPLAG